MSDIFGKLPDRVFDPLSSSREYSVFYHFLLRKFIEHLYAPNDDVVGSLQEYGGRVWNFRDGTPTKNTVFYAIEYYSGMFDLEYRNHSRPVDKNQLKSVYRLILDCGWIFEDSIGYDRGEVLVDMNSRVKMLASSLIDLGKKENETHQKSISAGFDGINSWAEIITGNDADPEKRLNLLSQVLEHAKKSAGEMNAIIRDMRIRPKEMRDASHVAECHKNLNEFMNNCVINGYGQFYSTRNSPEKTVHIFEDFIESWHENPAAKQILYDIQRYDPERFADIDAVRAMFKDAFNEIQERIDYIIEIKRRAEKYTLSMKEMFDFKLKFFMGFNEKKSHQVIQKTLECLKRMNDVDEVPAFPMERIRSLSQNDLDVRVRKRVVYERKPLRKKKSDTVISDYEIRCNDFAAMFEQPGDVAALKLSEKLDVMESDNINIGSIEDYAALMSLLDVLDPNGIAVLNDEYSIRPIKGHVTVFGDWLTAPAFVIERIAREGEV